VALFAELKRRNVFKASAAYLALSWVVIELTSTVAPLMNLPEWAPKVVLWLGVIGFPFVAMFSWVYELTPEGLKRESEVDRAASITHLTGRRLEYTIVGLLVLAIGLFAFHEFRPQSSVPAREVATAPTSAAPFTAPAAAAPQVSDQSIAVLPFVDMSQARDQEYFSDGLSEELLNLLAQIPQLHVAARTSAFSFKGKEVEIPEIARQLNVAYVLEGSVRKSGNKLRIAAQLIHAADGYHVWSETYDRQLTDVFEIQDDIAGAVVAQLKLTLLPTRQLTNTHRTGNTEAYNQYLLGNQFFNRGTVDGYRRAVAAYQQAIALDPNYGTAWAGLSGAEFFAADYTNTTAEHNAGIERAREAADKAIALAPDLADGYVARGQVRANYAWDWAGARVDLEQALRLEPGNALAQRRYGVVLASLGRVPEAIAATLKATELDPLSARTWNKLGWFFTFTGQWPAARESFDRALAISPDSELGNYNFGILELLQDRAQEALTAFRRAGEGFTQAGVAMAEYTLGHPAESQQALDELIAKYGHVGAYQTAEAYAWRGEANEAFDWLERAYVQRDGGLSSLTNDALLLPLHSDPRYAALVEKLGLPP